jgi:Trk K+ transport system NAD-binding subunit
MAQPLMAEESSHVILFGSGHLAFQVSRKLRDKAVQIAHIGSEHFPHSGKAPGHESVIEYFRRNLQEAGIDRAGGVYVLDDEDRHNIQFALIVISLNESIPVVVSLFNADLSGHVLASCKSLIVRNPALVAANAFVEALRAPVTRNLRYQPSPIAASRRTLPDSRNDRWLYALVLTFVTFLLGGTILFTLTERLSLLDAFYFTVTLMTTTGFGDISLRSSSVFAKLFGAGLMLSAVVLASLTFSFAVDRLFRKRSEIALGQKRYRLKDHVILCGLGRVGYEVAKELLRRGETVLVIEKDPHHRFLESIRSQGARIFVGDASIPQVLSDAGVERASGLFSLINDDVKNLEIGLNGRSLRPELRLILRVFDKDMAEQLRQRLDIHFAMSTSAIAAEVLVESIERK